MPLVFTDLSVRYPVIPFAIPFSGDEGQRKKSCSCVEKNRNIENFFLQGYQLGLKSVPKTKTTWFSKTSSDLILLSKNKFTSYTLKVSTPHKSENTNICWHTKNAESVARPCVCTKLLQQKILEPFEIGFFRERWNKMLNWSLVHTCLSSHIICRVRHEEKAAKVLPGVSLQSDAEAKVHRIRIRVRI